MSDSNEQKKKYKKMFHIDKKLKYAENRGEEVHCVFCSRWMCSMNQKDQARSVLLAALKGAAFFEQRFVKPLCGVLSNPPVMVAPVFLGRLLSHVPEELCLRAAQRAASILVNRWTQCPAPAEFRPLLAESVLVSIDLDFQKLYECAKLFLALPPTDPDVASTWRNRVIWTTIVRVGRDRFNMISAEAWAAAATETVLSGDLRTYAAPKKTDVPVVPRNYTAMLA